MLSMAGRGARLSPALLSVLVLAIFFLGACAAGRNYGLSLSYSRPSAPPDLSEGRGLIPVALSPFYDAREQKERIGVRRGVGSGTDFLQPTESLDGVVTKAVEIYLSRAGLELEAAPPWDLGHQTIPPVKSRLLFGGRIVSFWADVKSGIDGTYINASFQMDVVLASTRDGRLVWQNRITSTMEAREALFDAEKVAGILSSTLSNGINRILANPEVQRAIREESSRQ